MDRDAEDNGDLSFPSETMGVAQHKLDVLHSKQINRIMKIIFGVLLCCFFYVLSAILLTNTIFLHFKTIKWKDLPPIKFRVPRESPIFFGIKLSIDLVASTAMTLLSIIYPVRILLRNRYPVTQEQYWVTAMIISNAFSMNPVYEFLQLHDKALDRGHPWEEIELFKNFIKAMKTVRCIGSGFSIIFFLLGMSDAYGKLKLARTKREQLVFYIPKIVPLLQYQVIRVVARFHGKIRLSVIPFSNLVGMIANTMTLGGRWFQKDVIFVTLVTVFEVYFLVYFIFLLRRTNSILKRVDYLEYRSKQVGFRFFLFVNVLFYSFMLFFDILITAAVPRYLALEKLFTDGTHVFYNELYGGYSYEYLDVFYQYITAYAFLSPDSNGLSGWFKSSVRMYEEIDESKALSIVTSEETLLPRSSAESFFGRLRPDFAFGKHFNMLHLPVHIRLFNFAWLAYDYGRHGLRISRSLGFTGQVELCCEEYISEPESDTNLIIVSTVDMIVVSFKGTTSFANMKTDLNAVRTPLSNAIPTTMPSSPENVKDNEWKRATVHKGFLDVYRTVAKRLISRVDALQAKRERPIMLTGHSLGGALAMICSLDLCLSLGFSHNPVMCSTFGSPRVGNRHWCSVYDRHVPITWRFTHEHDLIPSYPKLGYKHVGKRVVLTNSGNIFLDPNSLEAVMWSTTIPSMMYHKKVVYWHCIRMFCQKYSEHEPEFWGHKLQDKEEIRTELSRLEHEYSIYLGGRLKR